MLSMKLKFFFFITVNYEEDFMSSITKFPLLCIKYESSQQSQCYALLQTGTKTGSLRPKDNQIKSNHLKKKREKKKMITMGGAFTNSKKSQKQKFSKKTYMVVSDGLHAHTQSILINKQNIWVICRIVNWEKKCKRRIKAFLFLT